MFLLTEISVLILNVFSINVKTFLATRKFSEWIFMLQRSKRLKIIVPHKPINAASSAIWQCLAVLIFPASSSLTLPEKDMFSLFSFCDRIFADIPVFDADPVIFLTAQLLIEGIGQSHRPVLSAGTADRDDELVFPL